MRPLERGRNTITSSDEIADISKLEKHRNRKKEEDLPYNKLFRDRELKRAIK